MQVIEVNKDMIMEKQTQCWETIRYFEKAYRKAQKDNDTFYMRSYSRIINRAQAEFNTLKFVLYQCQVKEKKEE